MGKVIPIRPEIQIKPPEPKFAAPPDPIIGLKEDLSNLNKLHLKLREIFGELKTLVRK